MAHSRAFGSSRRTPFSWGTGVAVAAQGALLLVLGSLLVLSVVPRQGRAQSRAVDLTLDSAVDLALSNSYRVRQLQMSVKQSRSWLQARQANLRSSAEFELSTPEIRSVSTRQWNSDQDRYEIVRENSRRWDMDLSVRQPVILFGYPTNGYLSFRNSMYRLSQFSGESSNLQYYNRYYVEFSQPFFEPNELKNNLEEARIDLQQERLDFQDNVVEIIDDISEDYFDLFELAYERVLQRRRASDLQRAVAIAESRMRAENDSVAAQRLRVELGNAREKVNQLNSEFRLQASRMKQQLRLAEAESVRVDPELDVRPVDVQVDKALEYGYSLRPRLRRLKLSRRERELALKNTRGWNSFRAELEATYGLEMRNAQFESLWDRPENSYSVGVNFSIPIWDWGRRDSQIQAREIAVRKAELRIEEARREIENDITNAVRSLNEYQDRALEMQRNLSMAANVSEASLDRFRAGEVSALELIQTLGSQTDTAQNLLDAYLGYRDALVDLLQYTYYDFRNQQPIFRRFDMGRYGPSPETIKDALQRAEATAD